MATRTPTPAWPRSPRRSPRNSPRAPQRQVPALTCVATYALAGRQLSTRRCCSPSWRRSPWRSPGSSASPPAGSPGVPSPHSSLTNEAMHGASHCWCYCRGRDKLNGWAARAATGQRSAGRVRLGAVTSNPEGPPGEHRCGPRATWMGNLATRVWNASQARARPRLVRQPQCNDDAEQQDGPGIPGAPARERDASDPGQGTSYKAGRLSGTLSGVSRNPPGCRCHPGLAVAASTTPSATAGRLGDASV
jgi:hypothetical protein